MNRAFIFDVNETMLDLGALDSLFLHWFGDPVARKEWFAQTLHFAMTLAATREFRNFGEVGAAALAEVAHRRGVSLPGEAAAQLRETARRLPAHRDVKPALLALRQAGLVTAALSNNPLPVVQQQLHHAGLSPLFDEIMSVDEAGALKPAPEVYDFAVRRLDLAPGSIWMVAAHGWDIAGAMRAGLRGAFVARPGQSPDPFAPPDILADDLLGVAHAIIAAEHLSPT
ncbi:MAG TPA: haloacid dehalogenase type II [Thermomicrobiales bacterium]|nr:haloacid dehalogenase type II [Thermomicrobiales bacterium]